MKVIYYGHACILVEVANRTLLFDPFISTSELAKTIDVDAIPADYILISNGHVDHIADAVAIAKRTVAIAISNFEVAQWLSAKGVKKTCPVNLGGTARFDFGRVKFVNAVHSSSLPDGTYGGNPGGFLVETPEGNFYFSGDTALTMDMKLIGESTPLKFAALCLGDTFTMGIEDAIKAAEFVRCEQVLGIHYDTVAAIKIDHDLAIKKFRAAGKELHLLNVGGSNIF